MKKGKGFTLVELLAVIVILAIILAIAIPSISNVISSSTKSSFESDAKMVLKAINTKMLIDGSFNETDINENNIDDLLGLENQNYSSVGVEIQDGVRIITIVGAGKWNNLIACGSYNNMKVVSSIDECGELSEPTLVTKTYLVSSGVDDGWTEYRGTESFFNDSFIRVGYAYSYRNLWVKWNNIDIPKGSIINLAKIQYKTMDAPDGYFSTPCKTILYFNNVGNAIAPTNYADAEGKTLTTNNVIWDMLPHESNKWYDTPDIASIVQEIIDRSDWNSGNSLMLMHRRHPDNNSDIQERAFYSYEDGVINAPKLVITYTTP